LRRARATFLAAATGVAAAHIEAELAARDRLLAAHHTGGYVLWFEADLYDQLQLIQVLTALERAGVEPAAVRLVCVGEHHERARCGGLGEPTADQLGTLRDVAAVSLSAAAFAGARTAWDAVRADTP